MATPRASEAVTLATEAALLGATDKAGDEAVLWGEGLPVERVADEIGTIPYELITKLTSRVFMEYV